jgi:hypothetical protein
LQITAWNLLLGLEKDFISTIYICVWDYSTPTDEWKCHKKIPDQLGRTWLQG